ncbi:MAG: protein kinase [Gemmatimonadaceae bacterium]|nr:protein kinase [Gemmatimonadaceae bacterium]
MTAPFDDDQEVADLERDYTLLGELGRGASAIVYRGRDRALHRDVAIKVVRPKFAANAEQAIERLEREARTVAKLQHPNIVSIFAVRRLTDGGLALVMQFVPGKTLKQTILDEGPFEPERAEKVMRDIAEALAFAHKLGVVHRDVKPENIFVDAHTGRALLSDFGIAHSADESRLTMTGAAIGTPAYMAPEQIDGGPANARSDLYSLGLVAWEMLTGHRPWEGEALYNVIFKQKHEELPAIDAVRPGEVPPRLQYIVERMIQKKPAARWAGADGVLAALNSWVVPSDWRQWEESHRRRREREKNQPKPVLGKPSVDSEATVKFARPPEGWSPDQALPAITSGERRTPAPAVVDTSADDEEAPSWATVEVEEPVPPPNRTWLYVAMVALLLGGGAFALFQKKMGPFAPRPASEIALADKGEVKVPVLPDSGRASGSDTMLTMLRDSLRQRANSDSLFRDSLTRAMKMTDSLRNDSLALLMRRQARAATRAPVGAAPAAPAPAAPAPTPTPAPEARIRATDDPGVIGAGGRHSCAVVSARVLCWGANDRGQLGDGDVEARGAPAPIVGDLDFTQVSTGTSHSCGVARGGAAYCWGANDRGQLGDATLNSRSAPVRVAGNESFRVVRAGQSHTCGLTPGGEVLCWGLNDHGQLGDGGAANRTTPTPVSGGLRFVSLSVGWAHTCGIAFDGTAYCWGANAAGQIGNGTRADVRTPTAVSASGKFTSISAGGTHSCAVSDAGEAFCWGRNAFGQLGIGGTSDAATPTAVSTQVRFASVTAGGVHSCGRTRAGQVWCWGRNLYGQIGDGTNTTREVPSRVTGPAFVSVNATGSHTCGVTGDDETWCWGYNVEGQLGDGTRNHLAKPTRVTMPGK